MGAMQGVGYPSRICRFSKHSGPIGTAFFAVMSCAKGTLNGDGLDQVEGCLMMGGAEWQMIHGKLQTRQGYMGKCTLK